MSDVTIKSTFNDPIVGLHAQADQLNKQMAEYSVYDNDVVSFKGKPIDEEDQIKLFKPIENFNFLLETSFVTKILIVLLLVFVFFTIKKS